MNYFEGVLLAQREDRWKDGLKLLREGASKNCDMCCWLLGEYYWYGCWVKADDTKAQKWLRKAIDLGNHRARFLLQEWEDFSMADTTDDHAKGLFLYAHQSSRDSIPYFLKAGNCFAQNRLGMFCDWGTMESNGRDWFEKSAKQGFFHSQYWLGLHLNQSGQFEAAVYWYRKSAEQGYVYAIIELADLLYLIIRNAAALYWFKRLREFGYEHKRYAEEYLTKYKIVFDKIESCRNSCFALITIRKYYQSMLSVLPKDIVILLAKYLWTTREEVVWVQEEEPVTKKIKK